MAEVFRFEQDTESYIRLSRASSEKGDRLKALLYARKGAEKNEPSAVVRLADALYESGNFEQSADIFLRLYFDGVRLPEVYSGLSRCFFDMSRLNAAQFFIKEGISTGALDVEMPDKGDKDTFPADLIPSLVFDYPFRTYSVSAARLIYPVKIMLTRGIPEFLRDTSIDVSVSQYRCAEILEDAFAVVVGARLDDGNAKKLLEVCNITLDKDPDNINALATKTEALAALGNLSEACELADEIRSFDVSGDLVELMKCAFAMLAVGDDEGVAEYTEEILTFCEELNVLLLTAIANINIGDYLRAKELLSYVLRIVPSHPVASYYSGLLHSGEEIPALPYSTGLPEFEIRRRKLKIAKLFERAPEDLPITQGERELLNWALRSRDFVFAGSVGVEMVRTNTAKDLVLSLLRSCTISPEVKRKWLTELLMCDSGCRQYSIFVDVPRTVSSAVFTAHCTNRAKRIYFTALSFLSVNNCAFSDKKLYQSFLDAVSVIDSEKHFIDEVCAAAAITLHARMRGLTKADNVSALFGKTTDDVSAAEMFLYEKAGERNV